MIRVRQVAGWAAAYVAALGIGLAIYAPALGGEFVGDDVMYIAGNPYVRDIDPERALEIVNPRGAATRYSVNYAPVHLLLQAAEFAAFGLNTTGYHVVNVAVHALASLLLGLFLWRLGLRPPAAAAATILFLVHPANVEAVAWISQLKTTGAMVFCLGALLCAERRPGWASLLLALGLLCKSQAVVALPMAAVTAWLRVRRHHAMLPGPRLLATWTVLVGLFAMAQAPAFQASNVQIPPLHHDPLLNLVNIVAIVGRYVAMAAATVGLSAFQQPEPIQSIANPWVALGAAAMLLIGWRIVAGLRHGDNEAILWLCAAASFAPVSQVFPFVYPVADRYLYFILPGLIGGVFLALQTAASSLTAGAARRGSAAMLIAALATACAYGARASVRARVWRSPAFVVADSAAHHPKGLAARLLKANAAASRGDAAIAARELGAAMKRGFDGVPAILADPAWSAVRSDPRVRRLLEQMAREWIEHFETDAFPTQLTLRSLAQMALATGDRTRAIDALSRAIELGGPLDKEIRQELAALRAGS